jgi:RNA polymerase sigma factor (sigma-70 family)
LKNENDIKELLGKFVELRDKCKKSRNKKLHAEFQKYRELCSSKFDYLIESRTRRYRAFSNYDDLRQDGRLALMLALNSYEPSKGDFYWWANQYIKTKICREANRHSSFQIPIKHTKEIQPYKVSQMPVIIDCDPDALSNAESVEIKSMVHEAIDKLPEDQKKIIQLYYEMDGFRQRSIGKMCEELNISRMSCIKLLNEAKESLKNNLEVEFC